MKARISSSGALAELCSPRLICLFASSANQRSTWLSQLAEAGGAPDSTFGYSAATEWLSFSMAFTVCSIYYEQPK